MDGLEAEMGVLIAVNINIKITFKNPTFLCIKKAVIKNKSFHLFTSFLRWLGQESGSCAFHCKENEPRKSLFVSLPLAVFLALKLNSQIRKQLVELLHKYALGVSYKKVLTIEVNFADQTRNNADIVCPTNLRQHIFTVAAQFPSSQKLGLDLECLRINS